MIRRPPRSTQSRSSAASDVYKRQILRRLDIPRGDPSQGFNRIYLFNGRLPAGKRCKKRADCFLEMYELQKTFRQPLYSLSNHVNRGRFEANAGVGTNLEAELLERPAGDESPDRERAVHCDVGGRSLGLDPRNAPHERVPAARLRIHLGRGHERHVLRTQADRDCLTRTAVSYHLDDLSIHCNLNKTTFG